MDDEKKPSKKDDKNYSHITSLIRAIHTPILNVSRPEDHHPLHGSPPVEQSVSSETPHLFYSSASTGVLPVIFDIDSSESSSKNATPSQSNQSLNKSADTPPVVQNFVGNETVFSLESNLEKFNKNVINMMDTLIKSHSTSSAFHSPPVNSKPFNFYHRIHRHHSSHSLNIPSIIVTGAEDHHHHLSHLKRFALGLRRHSHTHTVFMEEHVFCSQSNQSRSDIY